MATPKLAKELIKDISTTMSGLRERNLLRDENGISQGYQPNGVYEVTFSGKNDSGNIVYDTNISYSHLIDVLLSGRQYSVLLYDKSIIQAEFLISDNSLVKERFMFVKKHNKIWEQDEILEYEEISEEDWFSEEIGIPTILRVDFDPAEHKECIHAAAHLTLSNHESCRIPLKSAMLFSQFVEFVLFHFYGIDTNLCSNKVFIEDSITESEMKMIHLNWH